MDLRYSNQKPSLNDEMEKAFADYKKGQEAKDRRKAVEEEFNQYLSRLVKEREKEEPQKENKNYEKIIDVLYNEAHDLLQKYYQNHYYKTDNNGILDELQSDISKEGCLDCEDFSIDFYEDNTFIFWDKEGNGIYVDKDHIWKSWIKKEDYEPTLFYEFHCTIGTEDLLEKAQMLMTNFKKNHPKDGHKQKILSFSKSSNNF